MIKKADASRINRDKATKEQIAENFKRLAIDADKKVQLKPSLLKIQKTLDGKTFGIIHENKSYYLKYTIKNGSTNPVDFKHLDGLNATFGIEKYNSFDKAVNKMSFICEAQNNSYKLRLLNEAEEGEESAEEEKPKEKVITKTDQDKLLNDLDKQKEAPAEVPAPEMGGAEAPAEVPAPEMGGAEAPAPEMGGADAPMDTTPQGESPKDMADEILGGIGDKSATTDAETAAPEMGGAEAPAPEMGGADAPAPEMGGAEAPAEEADPKKEFQEAVGKLGQTINDLQDNEQFDEKDIKNAMNSIISAIGPEGFKLVGNKTVESFYKKMQGSQESVDNKKEEMPSEEEPATEKLDENILRNLKKEAKIILKEQLQEEIIRRKKAILIEQIKRKLI